MPRGTVVYPVGTPSDWAGVHGKPYVTVSAKGIVNGLSDIPNDGADFGPDTLLGATDPHQYGPPYTKTYGIQEAADWLNAHGGGVVHLRSGVYYLETNIDGSQWNGITIEGSGSNISIEGINNNFAQGTVITFANNYNGVGVSLVLPFVGTYTYYPLIYIVGTGANGSAPTQAGTNLVFTNFLLSGINTLNGTPYPNGMGLYAAGVWNLVVDHVDTQSMWWGKYFNLNGPSGNSNWYLNSTDAAPLDIGTSWVADEGGMMNCAVQGGGGGHVQAYNSNFTAYSFSISGTNAAVPSQAANIAYGNNTLILGAYCEVSGVMRENGYNAPAVLLQGVGSSLTDFYIFNATSQPVFTNIGPNGATPIRNLVISDGVITPSNNSSVKTPLANFFWGSSATQVAGSEVVFDNIVLLSEDTSGNTYYWANPIITQSADSGYVSPLVLRRIYGPSGGFYSYLPVSTPSVPASGTAQQNSNPYTVEVALYGGTVTQITITRQGTTYTVFSNSAGAALSGQTYRLDPGDSITLTYSSAPTWTWLPA